MQDAIQLSQSVARPGQIFPCASIDVLGQSQVPPARILCSGNRQQSRFGPRGSLVRLAGQRLRPRQALNRKLLAGHAFQTGRPGFARGLQGSLIGRLDLRRSPLGDLGQGLESLHGAGNEKSTDRQGERYLARRCQPFVAGAVVRRDCPDHAPHGRSKSDGRRGDLEDGHDHEIVRDLRRDATHRSPPASSERGPQPSSAQRRSGVSSPEAGCWYRSKGANRCGAENSRRQERRREPVHRRRRGDGDRAGRPGRTDPDAAGLCSTFLFRSATLPVLHPRENEMTRKTDSSSTNAVPRRGWATPRVRRLRTSAAENGVGDTIDAEGMS
jgi:hypothetical protein